LKITSVSERDISVLALNGLKDPKLISFKILSSHLPIKSSLICQE